MTDRNEALDELLDDCYEPMTIGFSKFYASDIFYNLDPIAYQIAASEMELDE
jgi:hypothetical protein